MSALPGVNRAYLIEEPKLAQINQVHGAPWQPDFRGDYLVASDLIRNHDQPAYLGTYDATESVNDWNPWEGSTGPHYYGTTNAPGTPGVIRYGYGSPRGLQEHRQAAPLAIDTFDRDPAHGQARLSGVSSIAALVPFLELPDYGQGIDPDSVSGFGTGAAPYHFDYGLQMDAAGGGAMGPRQVFRAPPTYSDQTAGVYAAGF